MTDSARSHNNPPSQIEFANESATVLGKWLQENPVIETEEVARAGKQLDDRIRLLENDAEDERKSRNEPYQSKIIAINDEYRAPLALLKRLRDELKDRLYAWVKKEEKDRLHNAETARRLADEARKAAQDAERRELDAKEDAQMGVETDVAAATIEADHAFNTYSQSERAAARAEADTQVKIGGGFGRRLSLRTKERLVVEDPIAALFAMGSSKHICAALITDAREYRRKHGQLPTGIVAKIERKL